MQKTTYPPALNNIALYTLMDHIDYVVFVKDRNGRFTFINEVGASFLGLNASEIIGKNETDIFGPSLGFESWERDYQVVTSGQPLTYEMAWEIAGANIKLKTTKYPVINQEGETLGIIGISQDNYTTKKDQPEEQLIPSFVTQAIQPNSPETLTRNGNDPPPINPTIDNDFEEQTSLNRSLLNLQSAMVAVTSSLDPKYIFDTLTWEMVNLLSVENCIAFNWSQENNSIETQTIYQEKLLPQDKRTHKLDDFPLFIQVIDDCRPIQFTKDQLEPTLKECGFMTFTTIQTLLLVPMIFQEQIIGLVGLVEHEKTRIFTDREISLALLLANQAANSIVNARLYYELNVTNEALKASNEELDAFAHTVSHDLKSPLSRMLGFSEFILQDREGISEEELSEFLTIIANNSRKMNDIINGLLMLASVRQEAIESEVINMAIYLSEAMNRLAFQFENHQIEFKLADNLPPAWGYGPWIEEVWINYLSNAVKYGGQPPCIEIGATMQENNMIRYWVKDNGQGLTFEQQEKLFIPFARLNQVNVEGHGLGLSIVQRIVNKLGGEVGIESALNQGSIFYFTLPGLPPELSKQTEKIRAVLVRL